MGELDAEFRGAEAPRRGDDAPERRLVVVGVQAHAAMGNAAVALDMCGLDDHEAGAGIGQHAEMHHVPIGGRPVVGRILAHGGDDNAVGKIEPGELDGREKGTAHGECYSTVGRLT